MLSNTLNSVNKGNWNLITSATKSYKNKMVAVSKWQDQVNSICLNKNAAYYNMC